MKLLLILALLPACGGVTMIENNTGSTAPATVAAPEEETPKDYTDCFIAKRAYHSKAGKLYYKAFTQCDDDEEYLGGDDGRTRFCGACLNEGMSKNSPTEKSPPQHSGSVPQSQESRRSSFLAIVGSSARRVVSLTTAATSRAPWARIRASSMSPWAEISRPYMFLTRFCSSK